MVAPGIVAVLSASTVSLVTVLPVFLFSSSYLLIAADSPFSVTELGILVAVYWLIAAATSRHLSRLVGSFGARACLALAAGMSAISLVLVALLPIRDWQWYLLLLALAGAANALAHPASNAMIISAVPPHRAATAFGLKQAAVPAAMMVAGFAVPILIAVSTWRNAFLAAGLFSSLLVLLLLMTRWPALLIPAFRPEAEGAGKADGRLDGKLTSVSWLSALGTGQANAIAAFSVVIAVSIGFSEPMAGVLVGIAGLAGVLSRLVVGFLADHRVGGTFVTVSFMLLVGALGALAMVTQVELLYAIGLVSVYCFGWGWNGLVHFLVSRDATTSAKATGQVQAGAYIGSAVGPVVFGLVADAWTALAAIAVCAAAAGIASVIAFRISRAG